MYRRRIFFSLLYIGSLWCLQALPQTELKQYGSDILQKRDLATALYNLFENDISNEVSLYVRC